MGRHTSPDLGGTDLAALLRSARPWLLGALSGGVLVAACYAVRDATARRTSRPGDDMADRYAMAVELLADKGSADIRIGGIYALERIAADSARDHSAVMAVLTAFIREHAGSTSSSGPPADVQAAVTVISRRIAAHDIRPIDLTGVDLRGVKLIGATLSRSILTGTSLRGATLWGAILRGADLRDADLTDASLVGADLHGADLSGANLTRADLTTVNLVGADLSDTDLTGVNLTNTELTDADLTNAKLPGT